MGYTVGNTKRGYGPMENIEQLNPRTAGKNKSFPPRHAKNKDKVAKKENGLDKVLIAKENVQEARRRPFVSARAAALPLLREYEPLRRLPNVRDLRENAQSGELTKHVFDEIVEEELEINEAARKLAEAWGLR